MPNWLRRLLTRWVVWYDPDADLRQHTRVITVAKKGDDAATRSRRALEAYERERKRLYRSH